MEKNKMDSWVKVSTIIQGLIAIGILIFVILQYNLNKRLGEKDLLERSYNIKQEAAKIIFKDDPEQLKEAQLRNIIEWTQEEVK